jgi:uncharacterized HAD superfamily protein
MNEINYKNVIQKLIESFSEFKDSKQYDKEEESPYVILGSLCHMAFDNIDQKQDKSLAEKLVKMADEITNNPNSESELVNLFQIEVFENMVGSRSGAILAKNNLHGKSIDLLKQTLKGFGSKEFEQEYSKG